MFYSHSGLSGIGNIGFWRETALAISQTNNAFNTYNISGATSFRIFLPLPAQIVGMNWGLDAAITAGTMNVELFINGAEVTQTTLNSGSGTSGVVAYATPFGVAAGQSIHVAYSSDAALATATICQVTLFGRFI